MSELYYVDGYNLLHYSNEWKNLAKDDLESARDALIDAVGTWCDGSGNRAKIIFDGRGRRTEARGQAAHLPRVEVLFSSRNHSADTIIERGVYEEANRERVVVVTADRGILDLCRGMGAMTMRPDHFLEQTKDSANASSRRLHQREGRGSLGALEEHLDDEQRERLDDLRRDL